MKTQPPLIEPPKVSLYQKILWRLMYVLIGVALVFIGVVFFWMLQNPNVLSIIGTPAVRPATNQPGLIEYMVVDFCKNHSVRGAVEAKMVGQKSIIRIPWLDEMTGKGCQKVEVPVHVPEYATDDLYYFEFTITYQINPVKEKIVTFKSETFTVMAEN